MNRREFLQIGSMFAAAMAIETNPVLKAAAKTLDSNPLQIVFYKVRERGTNKIRIKGTKYIDMANKAFDKKKFVISSFEVLEIVDNSIANETKKKLIKEHGATGHQGGGFDMELYNRIGQRNLENGTHAKFREAGKKAFMSSDYWHSDKHRKNLSKAAKAAAIVNKERGHIGGNNSNMANYKRDKKAKERAMILWNLPAKFLPGEAKKHFTNKQWGYIRETDLVIKTNERGGYHNAQYYYRLNYAALSQALQKDVNSKKYFETV